MDSYESLSHPKWECKYHVVFIPSVFSMRGMDGYCDDMLFAVNLGSDCGLVAILAGQIARCHLRDLALARRRLLAA